MELYCNLVLNVGLVCVAYVGGYEVSLLGGMEPLVKYHPYLTDVLTYSRDPGGGQCLVGSLTGAVAS